MSAYNLKHKTKYKFERSLDHSEVSASRGQMIIRRKNLSLYGK